MEAAPLRGCYELGALGTLVPAMKALGLSLAVPFTAVRLHATRDGSVHGVSVDGAYTPARARVMRRRDFVAAVLEIERDPQ